MKRCPCCNELIKEGTTICPYCGESLKPCPYCGELIEIDSKVCPWCAESLCSCYTSFDNVNSGMVLERRNSDVGEKDDKEDIYRQKGFNTNKKKSLCILIVLILVLCVAGCVVYYWQNNESDRIDANIWPTFKTATVDMEELIKMHVKQGDSIIAINSSDQNFYYLTRFFGGDGAFDAIKKYDCKTETDSDIFVCNDGYKIQSADSVNGNLIFITSKLEEDIYGNKRLHMTKAYLYSLALESNIRILLDYYNAFIKLDKEQQALYIKDYDYMEEKENPTYTKRLDLNTMKIESLPNEQANDISTELTIKARIGKKDIVLALPEEGRKFVCNGKTLYDAYYYYVSQGPNSKLWLKFVGDVILEYNDSDENIGLFVMYQNTMLDGSDGKYKRLIDNKEFPVFFLSNAEDLGHRLCNLK